MPSLLAQLGIGYERVPVDIFDGDTLTDAYALLNPQRSTPVLRLRDGRGRTRAQGEVDLRFARTRSRLLAGQSSSTG